MPDLRACHRTLACGGRRMILYRCSFCRCLLRGDLGQHGNRCPRCETGRLGTIARVTRRMLAEAELENAEQIGELAV